MPGQFFFLSSKLIPCKKKMWVQLTSSLDLETHSSGSEKKAEESPGLANT